MAVFPSELVIGSTTLARDPSRLLLCFVTQETDGGPPRRRAPREAIERALDELHLALEDNPWRRPPGTPRRLNHTQWALWARDVQGGAIDDNRLGQIRQVLAQMCRWVGPVYGTKDADGHALRICPLPSVLLIGLREGLRPNELARALRALGDLGLYEVSARSEDLSVRYFELKDPLHQTAYDLRDQVLQTLGTVVESVGFEQMPFLSPFAYEPRDEHYPLQWNMPLIGAPQAWDLTRGDPAIVVAVIDSGCDLGHPDLNVMPGFNLVDPARNGSPVLNVVGRPDPHGTHVAGIAAATIDNTPAAIGVAGVAGRCRILPLAVDGATDVQLAAGIRRAARTEGVRVINISVSGWWFDLFGGELERAIQDATRDGVLICASAGNGDSRGILSPARHPLVMACGGSDRRDERWSVTLPSGERRGSNYGDELIGGEWAGVSVMAPAWDEFPDNGMPTTDLTGPEGAVMLPSPRGDYWLVGGFSETSCAAPHLSGVAALLFSLDRGLGADAVRSIIERTADKVGSTPYAVVDGFPNGTRNEEMGYGRLNAYHAVDFADVMIRDWHGDEGLEPSAAPDGRFWVAPDIVVRPEDDGMFLPDDLDLSSTVVAGRPNYVYVRVVNKGPRPARAVSVDVRIVVPGLAFSYPADWSEENDTHIRPEAVRADLGTMAAGADDRAVFVISAEQADLLEAWSLRDQHPCVLAQVTSDNDHAFRGTTDRGDTLVARRNNLAQRNLRVGGTASAGLTYGYAVDAGDEDDDSPTLTLRVDAGALAREGRVELCVEPLDPQDKDDSPPVNGPAPGQAPPCGGRVRILDPVRVETDWCGCRAVITLAPGTEIAPGGTHQPSILKASGADLVGTRCVRLTRPEAVVVLARQPRTRVRVRLRCTLPATATPARYAVHLSQRGPNGLATGGVSLILGAAG